jgi:hypothetical protein
MGRMMGFAMDTATTRMNIDDSEDTASARVKMRPADDRRSGGHSRTATVHIEEDSQAKQAQAEEFVNDPVFGM